MYYKIDLYKKLVYKTRRKAPLEEIYDCTPLLVGKIIVEKKWYSAVKKVLTGNIVPVIDDVKTLTDYELYTYKNYFDDDNIASLEEVKKYIEKCDIENINKLFKSSIDYKLYQQKDIKNYLKKNKRGG